MPAPSRNAPGEWIVPSGASHAASIVFARKADGTWRFCQDYRGLNAITQPSKEPLPHVDQLVDETRGARFFSKLDLASSYHQFRIRPADQYKTTFRVPGGQYEFRVGAFGLHGMSSLLMRYMHSIFGRPALAFDDLGRPLPAGQGTPAPMLGQFVQVYMDDHDPDFLAHPRGTPPPCSDGARDPTPPPALR